MKLKSLVIRKPNDQFSEAMANDCIEAASKFGINVERIDGVYSDFDKLLTQEKLKINPAALKKFNTQGVKGCFLSHYFLWKMCVELNEPLLVFEHDGVMIEPLPNNILDQFDDYLNLDYSRHIFRKNMNLYDTGFNQKEKFKILKLKEDSKCPSGFKFMNRNHIVGAHGYIIKPSGAKKIINGILVDGICPADIAPNLAYVNMYYTSKTIVRVNEKMLKGVGGKSHTK